MNERLEYADARGERTLSGSDESIGELRHALDELRGGALCAECKVQPARIVVRRKLLMCRDCANVDGAMRFMDATAAKQRRAAKGRTS
jgi:hypothetical protein